jgi:hypothetical protein
MRSDATSTELLHIAQGLGNAVMVKSPVGKSFGTNGNKLTNPEVWAQTVSYFIVTVLGFSFWFFMVVPFASHRETYWWLAMVPSQPFAKAFGLISSTYRPLAQVATWSAFKILNPSIFPTSVLRQALLQGFVYGMFVLAWWFIYSTAEQRRVFALIAFLTGGVFFAGYVHLFHLYGIYYVSVMLTLGAIFRFHASSAIDKREVWFAVVATLLALWHPFATGLFSGFYFGFYLDTFRERSRKQHARAFAILLIGLMAVAAVVILFPRDAPMPLGNRLLGFLVSYQTNEVNRVASLVAFVLAQMVVASMDLSLRVKAAESFILSVLSVVFLLNGIPLLLLWFGAALMKLGRLHRWDLFFLMLAAALLPFGGGIGTPIYVLFAIIVATYATSLEWWKAERALSFFRPQHVIVLVFAAAIVVLMVRVGIQVPIVTKVANPLLAERERTYQLENILAWLHKSEYCGNDLAFVENAGSPIDSVESAIRRRNRPPSALEDVQLFWQTDLQCRKSGNSVNTVEKATVTFGGSTLRDLRPVFEIEGRYSGDATLWVRDSRK